MDLAVQNANYIGLPGSNPMVYALRQVISLGTLEQGWTTKIYGMFSDQFEAKELPDQETLFVSIKQAMTGWDAVSGNHPLGFGIVHMANDGIYLLLTRFHDANNIRHQVFALNLTDRSVTLAPLEDAAIIACVWEMRLIAHESDAWVKHVLIPGAGLTDVARQAYLNDVYRGTV